MYHAKLQAVKWYGQWSKYRQRKGMSDVERSNDAFDYEIYENSYGDTKSTLVTTTVIDGFEREDSY